MKDNSNDENNAICKTINNIISLDELVKTIKDAILDEPSINFGTGNIFRKGYNEELDLYVQAKYSAQNWLDKYQDKERAATDIPSLKAGYNSVFGYYIEITKIHSKKIPSHYERKQTLVNAERYTTPELKEFEAKILDAEFKIQEIEHRLFNEIKSKILEYIEQIQNNAYHLAVLDCFQSFATISKLNNYVKPSIDDSLSLEIDAGRHPVVEKSLPASEIFVPNNTFMDTDTEQIHIITGPNMAGKSCYLRQTALIVLMGQIGCFVPANKAHFGFVDRIFTRVGAQDNISAGESTFLVEMQETAYILNNATKRSLILLDEVGRGTATFDGISIAWAIAEYIHEHIKAKTLFATHYHELNDLESKYNRIINYRADVLESGSNIVFTHNISKGAKVHSYHSYGIYVGRMAGLPYSVVHRASEIMGEFEKSVNTSNNKLFADTSNILTTKKHQQQESQLSIFEIQDDAIRDKLRNADLNSMTPLQALQYLQELKNCL
ncbi:MAG: DNA mismatch repair protein MutS [Bacteroidetes bacterium]|nr:DNA mismatch repair protein MutS [Bacteroidota bacterium]